VADGAGGRDPLVDFVSALARRIPKYTTPEIHE